MSKRRIVFLQRDFTVINIGRQRKLLDVFTLVKEDEVVELAKLVVITNGMRSLKDTVFKSKFALDLSSMKKHVLGRLNKLQRCKRSQTIMLMILKALVVTLPGEARE